MSTQNPTRTKRTFWAVLAFYFLIAFEFFYMASPFAVYFYSAYRPGLNLLNAIPGIAWLSSFYLPHIVVETNSPLINAHNVIGAILMMVGLLAFGICAGQVYYSKLARKQAVTDGLYRYIRHPQYAAFMLSSFGMLVLWPRFLVLLMFVTMCFAYYFLARIEERECEEKFGQSYIDYKHQTGMFLPFKLPLLDKLPSLPARGWARFLSIAGLYLLALAIAFGLGLGIKRWALNSLYALYTPEAAFVSVAEIEDESLEQIKAFTLSDQQVQATLKNAGTGARFINYVVPTIWSISEIPMVGENGHSLPQDYDRTRYKVIFTQAQLPEGRDAQGQEIMLRAVHKTPLLEVWVDLGSGEIIQILEPPETVQYDGVPVPIY